MSRRVTAWRAAIRIARRDAWRNKGRSSLIALMVALPILAASTISVLYQSDDAEPRDQVALQVGAAQASVNWSVGADPVSQDITGSGATGYRSDTPRKMTMAQFEKRLAAAVPNGDRVGRRATLHDQHVDYGNRLLRVGLVELDYAALGSGAPVTQLSGQSPQQPDQVVISRSLQRRDGLKVGDKLSWRPDTTVAARTYSVVGVVGGLPLIGSAQVLGLPGSLIPAALQAAQNPMTSAVDSTWFVAGPTPVTWNDVKNVNQLGATVLSRYVADHPDTAVLEPSVDENYSSVDRTYIATGAVVVGLILLQVALMAGPAIAVGTRRNERGLAVVAASGGEGKHLRAVVLAGSALIGLVASVTAVVLGTGLASILIPVMRSHWEVGIARTDIHLLDLVGLVAVGTLTTFAAALLPARRVRKLDVVAALTGRRTLGAPKLRVPLTGLVLVVVGLVLAWFASVDARQFLAVLGLGITEVGLVIASPAVVGLSARLAARSSFATRFAFRDAARQRGRTAPAVAAVLAAIAGGMTALVFVAAQTDADRLNYSSQVPVGVTSVSLDQYNPTYSPDRAAGVMSSLRENLPVKDLAVIREAPTDFFVNVLSDCGTPVSTRRGESATSVPDTDCRTSAGAWFAGPDVAPAFSAGDATREQAIRAGLAAGKVVVFDRQFLDSGGRVRIAVSRPETAAESAADEAAAPGPIPASESLPAVIRLPAVLVRLGQDVATPLIPVSLAKTLDVTLQPTQVIAETTGTVSTADEQRAEQALQRSGLTLTVHVERGYTSDLGWFLATCLAAAGIVALIGTFTAVGLAAAENRSDLGTLAAVGAAPATRRRLAAAQAAAIVVPGTLLGLVSGTAAGWVLIKLNAANNASYEDPANWHLTIPWEATAVLGLGIPVLAVLVGFATVRSRLVVVRRLGE